MAGPHKDTHIEARIVRIETAAGLIEQSVGLIQGAAERIERSLTLMASNIADINAKFDAFTTGYAAVIDSAVARIVTEVQKQGQITPDMQASLDHLSTTADVLIAANAANLDKIAAAGAPAVVPPSGPVPDPVVPPDVPVTP